MCKVMSRRWMGRVCWNPSQSYCPSSDIGISRAAGPELVWGLEQREVGFQMQRPASERVSWPCAELGEVGSDSAIGHWCCQKMELLPLG